MKNLLLASCTFLLGTLVWQHQAPPPDRAPDNADKRLTLRSLTVVDDKGRPRWTIEGERPESKSPEIRGLNAEGKPRISLELEGGETPVITLNDSVGRVLLELRVEENGNPSLCLFNSGEKYSRCVVLGVRPVDKLLEGYVECRASDGSARSVK